MYRTTEKVTLKDEHVLCHVLGKDSVGEYQHLVVSTHLAGPFPL